MTTTWIRFINILIAALLAGTSFGIWMGFSPMDYSASNYLEQQQRMVQSLQTLMVSLVVLATLLTVVSAFLHRKNKMAFIGLLLAAACFAACIVITRFGNLPIQKEMLLWKADAMPADWLEYRDAWWGFHVMRTIAELIGLALVTWIGIDKTSPKTA